ncbi:MAG: (Na+)-NQR maturation NqrM [Deltaproteobacteria bacterium]|nr:(Na+)-NQR maturation NqrM [Deltaproteobacteria bacterium]
MEVFFISFVIIGLAILGMALGVLMGRSAIKGSCGGLSTIDGSDKECPVCGAGGKSDEKGTSQQRLVKCS